ncbi:MAG: trehalose-phosphatase [Actinomycetota bacterium]
MSLDAVRSMLSRVAILLDFDGTLAPIVPEPEDARPSPGVVEVLADLAERAGLVAIISGRPEAFIRDVLEVSKVEVIGLYGLEGAPALDPVITADIQTLVAGEEGARVEDKGVSLSVHVRGAPDPDATAARLRGPVAVLAARHGLTVFEGKRVIELAPPGARKGGVVRQIMVRMDPAGAVYAGDDLEDREAYAALDALNGPTCRIAVLGAGTPDELRLAADLLVEGPPGLLEVLRTL